MTDNDANRPNDPGQRGRQGAEGGREKRPENRSRSSTRNSTRNSVILPLVLIVIGVLVLAGNLGFMSWSSIWDLLNLWPVLLIAIGVDLLTSGRFRWIVAIATIGVAALAMTGWFPFLNVGNGPPAEVHEVQIPVEGAERAEVGIRVGVSELDISSLSDGDLLVSGTVRTAEGETFTQDTQRSGGTAAVELVSERRGIGNVTGNVDRRWELGIARGIPTELTINTGVGRSQLDLRDLTIVGLRVDAGVGEMVATLPGGESYQARFDTGVGATTVRVPEDAAVRISIDKGLGSVTARGGFDALGGDVYQTPDYEDADERIDIRIDGGVGAITIERIR